MLHRLLLTQRAGLRRGLASRAAASTDRPLQGVTVVALEQAVAAPLCTARLADDGARVIKVERLGTGDFARQYDANACAGQSSYFVWLNRGKESLTLDLKDPESLALLRKIILDEADVFVQNLAPGAVGRMGLDWETLSAEKPSLITLDISGYGDDGPMSAYKAYDLLVCAEAGLCSITGTPDGPGRAGISLADISAGLNGYAAVQRALFCRERSAASGGPARGAALAVSLFDALAEQMAVPYLQQRYTGASPARIGLKHPSICPYGAFGTQDGRWLLISIQNEREWRSLCVEILEDGDEVKGLALAEDERFSSSTLRVANRAVLDPIVAAKFGRLDAQTASRRLLEAGIAFGALNSVEDLVEHPQLRTVEYATPAGENVVVPASAVRDKRGVSAEAPLPVPALGQHTDAIITEFTETLKN